MTTTQKIEVVKDLANKKITVTRSFDARRADVWKAWTDAALLDLWWAPKPWKAETKSIDFTPGGHWLYAMAGPDGERHWCKADITTVDVEKNFTSKTYFCDEQGSPNDATPTMYWDSKFLAEGDSTKVIVTISFEKEADLSTIIEMGFQQGFTSALENLDEYLAIINA